MLTLIYFNYSHVLPQPAKAVWFNTKCLSSWEMEHVLSHQQCFCLQVHREHRFYAAARTSAPPQVPELRIRQQFLSVLPALPEVHFCPYSQTKPTVSGGWIPLLSPPRTGSKPRRISQMGGLPGCWIMTGKESTNWNFHLDLWGWICFLRPFSQSFSLSQAPDDGAANKPVGTNTSIHHNIPASPLRIITTLKRNCLALFCVFFPIFTGWVRAHDLISLLNSTLTSCLLWFAFIFWYVYCCPCQCEICRVR